MIQGIGFLHLPVRDLARAERFYRKILGTAPKARAGPWVEFVAGGFHFALKRERGRGAVVHFEVKDIEAAVRRLRRWGVRSLSPIRHFPYGSLAEFEDPDGNRVGLYEKGK